MRVSVTVLFTTLLLGLVGCQATTGPTEKTRSQPSKSQTADIASNDGDKKESVKITPYPQDEIQRKKMQVVLPAQKPQPPLQDGHNLPAFKQLMQATRNAYQKRQWSQAEATALQAQRLAPQAAETYLYLGLIANQRHQAANAEALARRGLSYAKSNAMKKQLWQVILQAGQKQRNPKTIQQAQQALKSL